METGAGGCRCAGDTGEPEPAVPLQQGGTVFICEERIYGWLRGTGRAEGKCASGDVSGYIREIDEIETS